MSLIVKLKVDNLSGSIQIRMAYLRSPMLRTSPTPLILFNSSIMLRLAKFDKKSASCAGLLDSMVSSCTIDEETLRVTTPFCFTTSGNIGVARATLFCTSTAAMSKS